METARMDRQNIVIPKTTTSFSFYGREGGKKMLIHLISQCNI